MNFSASSRVVLFCVLIWTLSLITHGHGFGTMTLRNDDDIKNPWSTQEYYPIDQSKSIGIFKNESVSVATSITTFMPSFERHVSRAYCMEAFQLTERVNCMNITHHQDQPSLKSQLKLCKLQIEDTESKYNDALQKFIFVEERFRQQEDIHNKTLSSFELRLVKMAKDMQELKRKDEKSREMYLESVTARTNLEKELNEIRFTVSRTYINTTLIVQDCTRAVSRRIDRLFRSNDRVSRWMKQKLARMKARLNLLYHEFIRPWWTHPWVQKFHSDYLFEILENTWFFKMVFPLICKILEGTKLSIASIIETLDILCMRFLHLPYRADEGLLHPSFRENKIAIFLFMIREHACLIADYILGYGILRSLRWMFPTLWALTFRIVLLGFIITVVMIINI